MIVYSPSNRRRERGEVLVTHVADLELTDGPLWKHRLREDLHHQIPVVQRLSVLGPVVVTLHLEEKVTGEKTNRVEENE